MKDCIRDFIDSWKKWDDPNSPFLHWDRRFRDAGYHSAILSDTTCWDLARKWCQDAFGEQHFAWTGLKTFWFEQEDHAVLFRLRWL